MSSRSRRVPACQVCKRRPGVYSRWLHGTICRVCWRKAFRRQSRACVRLLLLHPHPLGASWWQAFGIACKGWVRGR